MSRRRDEWRWADPLGQQRLVRTDELLAALASGAIPPNAPVWKLGWPDWRAAYDVAELTTHALAAANGIVANIPPPPAEMVAVHRQYERDTPSVLPAARESSLDLSEPPMPPRYQPAPTRSQSQAPAPPRSVPPPPPTQASGAAASLVRPTPPMSVPPSSTRSTAPPPLPPQASSSARRDSGRLSVPRAPAVPAIAGVAPWLSPVTPVVAMRPTPAPPPPAPQPPAPSMTPGLPAATPPPPSSLSPGRGGPSSGPPRRISASELLAATPLSRPPPHATPSDAEQLYTPLTGRPSSRPPPAPPRRSAPPLPPLPALAPRRSVPPSVRPSVHSLAAATVAPRSSRPASLSRPLRPSRPSAPPPPPPDETAMTISRGSLVPSSRSSAPPPVAPRASAPPFRPIPPPPTSSSPRSVPPPLPSPLPHSVARTPTPLPPLSPSHPPVVGAALAPAWRPRPPSHAPLSIHELSSSALEPLGSTFSGAITMHHITRRDRDRMRNLAIASVCFAVLVVLIAVVYLLTSRP